MRISEWSSDVCSSDLLGALRSLRDVRRRGTHHGLRHSRQMPARGAVKKPYGGGHGADYRGFAHPLPALRFDQHPPERDGQAGQGHYLDRSEEHTSELQSLMRISYAVFCLKKKINNYTINENYKKQTQNN